MKLIICNVISVICLIFLALYTAITVVKTLISPRKEALSYLRNFRKGRFAFIYVSMLPLYMIAFLYNGTALHLAFFKSLTKLVNLVVLKYEYGEITALIEASNIFNITLHTGFVLVAFNVLLFTLSLVHQRLSNALHLFYLRHTGKPKLYIFGEREENADIYFSEENMQKLLIADLDDDEKEALYFKKIFYHKENNRADFVKGIFNELNKGEITVVINEVNSQLNLDLCKRFIEQIEVVGNNHTLLQRLKVFVFGNPAYEEIYLDLVKQGRGCLRYVDPFHEMAVDFIDKYPLSSFLSSKHVDYSTALLKPETDINVIFVGFGYTNRQVFLTSVANNQFLTSVDGKIKLKPVDYYIIDKEEAKSDKNLNHSYNRYKQERKDFKPEDYLELPDLPANEHYLQININDGEFYGEIKKILCKNPNSINIILLSLGNDLDNLDVTKKLCVKKDEWGIENCYLFCKSSKEKLGALIEGSNNCFYFGNETTVYNLNNIKCDNLTQMALLRNAIYDIEYSVKNNGGEVIDEQFIENYKKEADERWFSKKTQAERESSLYCCLSLRSKLNLIGLDYCLNSEKGDALSYEEYMQIYAKGDMPNTTYYKNKIDGKHVIKYGVEFAPSKRKNLAILEHYRWNSFMITQGFVPASKEVIKKETVTVNGKTKHTNGKSYAMRRHGNLTTFEGLVEYANILCERDGITKEQADVISYDYQIMDDAYWLLEKSNMKIIKK